MALKSYKMEHSTWDELAENYAQEIISPLLHADEFPLWKYLDELPRQNELHVVDIGCGRGTLIPHLAKRFRSVCAFDFSPEMVTQAQALVAQLPSSQRQQVSVQANNILKPKRFNKKFDCAIAINSILFGDPRETKKAMNAVAGLLKNNGIFLGVFPALESIQEQYRETFIQELKAKKSIKQARYFTSRKFRETDVDFALGLYDTEDMVQKYYTQFELQSYLKRCGLKEFYFERVIYRPGPSYNYESNQKTRLPPMWDWFVKAVKSR